MAKVITVRVSDGEYKKISAGARIEHRPISNFITAMVLKGIEEGEYVDSIEMDQILSDKKLMAKIQSGHKDAKRRKGRLVG